MWVPHRHRSNLHATEAALTSASHADTFAGAAPRRGTRLALIRLLTPDSPRPHRRSDLRQHVPNLGRIKRTYEKPHPDEKQG